MTKEKIQEFAQTSIFDTAEYIGKWEDYEVWEPGFSDGEPRCIGFPQFILVKGETIRWSKDWEESREIMEEIRTK